MPNFPYMKHSLFVCLGMALAVAACTSRKKEPPRYSQTPVTSAQPFAPGTISTAANSEFDICFTPDGYTAYFTRREPESVQKIYKTVLEDGQWSPPEIAPFSTDRDETPFIAPDGAVMYFGSERAIPGKPNRGGFDMNIWKMEWEGDSWSDPEPLPEPINYVQEEGENWPSSNANYFFTLDGKSHLFTTQVRGSASIEIYTTDRGADGFSEPQPIPGLLENDSLWKYSASISPDGNYLVFNSFGAPGGQGGEDIYVSKKTGSGWSQAVNIGNLVNSPGEEGSARFSPDGRYFFFSHADNLGNYEYGPWSIYYLETAYLHLDELFDKVVP